MTEVHKSLYATLSNYPFYAFVGDSLCHSM